MEADQVWAMASPRGGTVTGKGVTIGDIDTGVDVRHASFFVLTDERFDWLDLDGSGGLSAGDAVDLDGDNRFGPGEALAHREAIGTARYGNVLGVYDTDLDYLLTGNRSEGVPLRSTRLIERFRELEEFSSEDREAVLRRAPVSLR